MYSDTWAKSGYDDRGRVLRCYKHPQTKTVYGDIAGRRWAVPQSHMNLEKPNALSLASQSLRKGQELLLRQHPAYNSPVCSCRCPAMSTHLLWRWETLLRRQQEPGREVPFAKDGRMEDEKRQGEEGGDR